VPVLSIDTSAAVAVSLTDDAGTVLAARVDDQQRRHAEQLAPMIVAVLSHAGVDRGDLSAIVVGTGPAPFTGLRVGLVTARTLGLALGVPVEGVPSLDALAAAASRIVPAGTPVLVATDARRREVYRRLYLAEGPGRIVALDGPAVGPAADAVADQRATGAVVVGRGALLYPEAFVGHEVLPATASPDPAQPDLRLLDPDPAELARLAAVRAAAGEPLSTEPLYLRRPDAVPPAARKRVLT